MNDQLIETTETVDTRLAVSRQIRKALFSCQECGHKFYSVKAAERALDGDSGCPGCGGSDIDAFYGGA